MFKTHETVAVDLLGEHGEGYRHWRLIERDLNHPWFHLTVSFYEGGIQRIKSVLPNDTAILSNLVSQAGDGIEVIAVQAVLPPHITGKQRWIMMPLVRLETARLDDGMLVQILHGEDGEIYTDPLISRQVLSGLAIKNSISLAGPLLRP